MENNRWNTFYYLYCIYVVGQRDFSHLYDYAKGTGDPLITTTLIVSLTKIAAIAAGILLLKWMIRKIYMK